MLISLFCSQYEKVKDKTTSPTNRPPLFESSTSGITSPELSSSNYFSVLSDDVGKGNIHQTRNKKLTAKAKEAKNQSKPKKGLLVLMILPMIKHNVDVLESEGT